jgi:hypothetical protein
MGLDHGPTDGDQSPRIEVSIEETGESEDPLRRYQEGAIKVLSNDQEFLKELKTGIPWGKIVGLLSDALPGTMHNRADVAYHLVKPALEKIIGPQDLRWKTERRGTRNTTFVVLI